MCDKPKNEFIGLFVGPGKLGFRLKMRLFSSTGPLKITEWGSPHKLKDTTMGSGMRAAYTAHLPANSF